MFHFSFSSFQLQSFLNIIEKTKVVKDNELCPITLISSVGDTFQLNDEQERRKQTMEFRIELANAWQPANVSIGKTMISGAYFKSKTSAPEALVIFQTVSKLDKRRIYLRSPVQLVNTLEVCMKVRYPTSATNSGTGGVDFSRSALATAVWKEVLIEPGKKWCLPLENASQKNISSLQVAPVLKEPDAERFPEQIVNWTSSQFKMLVFNQKLFVQVTIQHYETECFLDDLINLLLFFWCFLDFHRKIAHRRGQQRLRHD